MSLASLAASSQCLEAHFRDSVQFEFVIEDSTNKLYILQTHTARRTVKASVKVRLCLLISMTSSFIHSFRWPWTWWTKR